MKRKVYSSYGTRRIYGYIWSQFPKPEGRWYRVVLRFLNSKIGIVQRTGSDEAVFEGHLRQWLITGALSRSAIPSRCFYVQPVATSSNLFASLHTPASGGAWWVSGTDDDPALERIATVYEVAHADEPPHAGWRLVTATRAEEIVATRRALPHARIPDLEAEEREAVRAKLRAEIEALEVRAVRWEAKRKRAITWKKKIERRLKTLRKKEQTL